MALQFEYQHELVNGKQARLGYNEEGILELFYIPSGQTQLHKAPVYVDLGLWDTATMGPATLITNDQNITAFASAFVLDGKQYFAWVGEDERFLRYAVFKDEGTIYENSAPYRLYYAVDTEKLYMNISDHWEFVASPNIENLVGFEELMGQITTLRSEFEAYKAANPPTEGG